MATKTCAGCVALADMKLITVCSASHTTLKDTWFLPTLEDDYEVRTFQCDVEGPGTYLEEDWTRAVLFKSATIVNAIEENWGDVFVYSDVDVTFFGPTKTTILEHVRDKDVVCQLDHPCGTLCTGFFGIRANKATLRLWRQVHDAVEQERRDQVAFNRFVREFRDLRVGYLPSTFFGPGTFSGRLVHAHERVYVPAAAVMFHANYTIGVTNKMRLLSQISRVVHGWKSRRAASNFVFRVRGGNESIRAVASLTARGGHLHRDASAPLASLGFVRPATVALDASTACQLRCPSCPTATGAIGKSVGTGFLTIDSFKKFVADHPWVSDIELSNWGEVFLNPGLEHILEHAHRHCVALRIDNGANLDRASDRQLDAVVRYRLRSLSCSIDGASEEVYSTYRVRGSFERVISHIRQINANKQKYRSQYPLMRWQFVALGHNTHEIGKARDMAQQLGMEFHLKLSWDDLYAPTFSPVIDVETVKRESGLNVADRREYEEKFGRNYIARSCHQLWLRPRINFDGRLLGCSINYWDDFGNVFNDGLEACLSGDKMQHTRRILMGLAEADESTPCRRCSVYHSMVQRNTWVKPEELDVPRGRHPLVRQLLRLRPWAD
jgi:MoaA/NifB/PqqE/SkfB family radical SAM enzyme